MRITALLFFLIILLLSCQFSSKQEKETMLIKELWSQSDTSYTNFRIPSVIVTKSNTLLAFAEGREGGDTGNIDLLLKRSTDNGHTWETQTVVWNDGNNTCGNPCPVVDRRTGRIILFMTWNLGSDHESDIIRKKSENTRVPYMTYSDDDGLTWAEPQNMLKTCKDTSWGWYATGPGVGIQLTSGPHKGRLVIPCNNSYNAPDFKKMDGFGYGCHVLLSDDSGNTWRMSEMIKPLVNESQVVELSDGTLMMNMRSYHDKACRAISLSTDGGETWSDIQHAAQLAEPVCQASIICYGNYKDENMYLFSNPAVPFSRTNMTIKTSFNNCSSWCNSKLVYEGPSAYSCLTKLPNGNVGLFFECGDKSPYEKMLFVSFHPKELFTPGPVLNHIIKE